MPQHASIRRRKTEHLALCRRAAVEFQRKRTWLEYVHFAHQAAPEFALRDVDLSVEFLGKRLAAPFIIGAMTGGTPEAAKINRVLAVVAAEKGVGLALGSQRPMLESPALDRTFQVRDVASDILLLGNIGLSQAIELSPAEAARLIARIGADGLCLHLNAAMEIFQKEGDEPLRGADGAIRRLSRALGQRLIVKETGCGLSRETVKRLVQLGVRTVDVAGAGGTSWVRVENLRRGGAPEGLAEFEEWGLPTAASLIEVRGLAQRTIASGGVRTGLDLAKCIALGADIGSAALPVLRALDRGGQEGVRQWIDSLIAGLRTAMLLTGCRTLAALRRAPVVITGPLREWGEQRSRA